MSEGVSHDSREETNHIDRRRPRDNRHLKAGALLGAGLLIGGLVGLTAGHHAKSTHHSASSVKAPNHCEVSQAGKKKQRERTPCLAIQITTVDHVRVVTGYIGLANGRPLTGAKVELLGGKVAKSLNPTGDRTLSDGHGHFSFVIADPVPYYATRMQANRAYLNGASSVVRDEP